MCKVFSVSKNAYYYWLKQTPTQQKQRRDLISREIKKVWKESFKTYGSPRITMALQKQGFQVSRKYVAKLMNQLEIKSIIRQKYVVTTDSKHDYSISENKLKRAFKVEELGKVWVSDITYVKVKNDWCYLTTIIDLASRKVVGWSFSNDLTTENTIIKAWNHAKSRHFTQKGLIFHSDRGVQYASTQFRKILQFNQHVEQSMSRKGNCWDNAVAESFFKSIKNEFLRFYKFNSFQEAKSVIFHYIEGFYNNNRLHSAIEYMTPVEKENQLLLQLKNVA